MYISEMELLPNTKYKLLSITKSAINQWLKLVLLLFHRAGGGGIKTKTAFLTLVSFPLGLNGISMVQPPQTYGMVMSNSSRH